MRHCNSEGIDGTSLVNVVNCREIATAERDRIEAVFTGHSVNNGAVCNRRQMVAAFAVITVMTSNETLCLSSEEFEWSVSRAMCSGNLCVHGWTIRHHSYMYGSRKDDLIMAM